MLHEFVKVLTKAGWSNDDIQRVIVSKDAELASRMLKSISKIVYEDVFELEVPADWDFMDTLKRKPMGGNIPKVSLNDEYTKVEVISPGKKYCVKQFKVQFESDRSYWQSMFREHGIDTHFSELETVLLMCEKNIEMFPERRLCLFPSFDRRNFINLQRGNSRVVIADDWNWRKKIPAETYIYGLCEE